MNGRIHAERKNSIFYINEYCYITIAINSYVYNYKQQKGKYTTNVCVD